MTDKSGKPVGGLVLHVGRAYRITRDLEHPEQRDRDGCFLGGHPLLPESVELPACALCKATMAFAMHVEFPKDHPWWNTNVATFVCLACGPQKIWDAIARAPQPRDYTRNGELAKFEAAQTCYRFVCSPGDRCAVRRKVKPAFPFCRLLLSLTNNVAGGSLGGVCHGDVAAVVHGNLDSADFTHLFSIGDDLQAGLVPVGHKPDGGAPFRLFNIICGVRLRVFGSLDHGVRVCYPYIEL